MKNGRRSIDELIHHQQWPHGSSSYASSRCPPINQDQSISHDLSRSVPQSITSSSRLNRRSSPRNSGMDTGKRTFIGWEASAAGNSVVCSSILPPHTRRRAATVSPGLMPQRITRRDMMSLPRLHVIPESAPISSGRASPSRDRNRLSFSPTSALMWVQAGRDVDLPSREACCDEVGSGGTKMLLSRKEVKELRAKGNFSPSMGGSYASVVIQMSSVATHLDVGRSTTGSCLS
mmetsp:Transcript_9851/g.28361  ORF Transcript_9851/g.28361 Transcript_9851/m.28361 type:complete len:233 (-) Transcript_9851:975-1673(-)